MVTGLFEHGLSSTVFIGTLMSPEKVKSWGSLTAQDQISQPQQCLRLSCACSTQFKLIHLLTLSSFSEEETETPSDCPRLPSFFHTTQPIEHPSTKRVKGIVITGNSHHLESTTKWPLVLSKTFIPKTADTNVPGRKTMVSRR